MNPCSVNHTDLLALLHKWIKSLVKLEPDMTLFDSNFSYEDGFSAEEYVTYEKKQFAELSSIFDLTEDFRLDIIHTIHERKGARDLTIVYFHIINHLERIVCRTQATVYNGKISGNDFFSHITAKYVIEYEKIVAIGLAIHAPQGVRQITCAELECVSLFKGDNYDEDGFYSARFVSDDLASEYLFYFFYEDGRSEKRRLFFEPVEFSLKPYILEGETLVLSDTCYPVNISFHDLKHTRNISYPRNFSLSNYTKHKPVIITDALDNDWLI